jgi:hypothetical protein
MSSSGPPCSPTSFPSCPSGSPRSASRRPGWPPNSATAGSPRWWRATVPAEGQAVLDQLAAYGTAGHVREQLGRWDHAADIVTILLPPGLPWDTIEATLRAAAPAR